MIEIILNSMYSLSKMLFEMSKKTFINIDMFLSETEIFEINQLMIVLSILIVSIFLGIKYVSFLSGKPNNLKGWFKENRNQIVKLMIIFIVALLPKEILQFSFGFWNSFFNETEVFNLLENTPYISGENISTLVFMMVSSLSAVFIGLNQILEFVLLLLVLMLSPFFLIGSLFQRQLSAYYIKVLLEKMISPIIQTLTMFFFIQYIYPSFENTGIISILILFVMIYMSYKASKNAGKVLFTEETGIETLSFSEIKRNVIHLQK